MKLPEIFDMSILLPDGTCADGIRANSPLLKKQKVEEKKEGVISDIIEGDKADQQVRITPSREHVS